MRILKYAFRNIIRNPFLSISSIFVITLLIFFVNILLGVLYTSEKFIESVNDRIAFTISFQSGYTTNDMRVRALASTLQDTFTGITIDMISKREALQIMKERNPDLTGLIETNGENPLPDSVRIGNIPKDEYSTFSEIISSEKEMLFYDKDALDKKYLDFQSQFQRVSLVVVFLSALEYGVIALLILFLFTVAVIIYTVIGNSIFFHRQEIEIIELVGGRKSFIYGQFLFQGVFYAIVASILALTFIFVLVFSIPSTFFTGLFVSFPDDFLGALTYIVGGEFFVFFLLGMISAFLALRRYTKL